MEVKHKKTTLGDEAALYHHREDISEKEKWNNMTGKERWNYFKNYYLLKVLGILVTVIVVVSILNTILAPKPEKLLSVAIANGAMKQEQYLKVQEDFQKAIGMDEETQETIFDGGYDFEYDLYQSMQKFAIYNAVGDLDVTIMPLSVFEVYAPKGYFATVSSRISDGLYAELAAYLVESGLTDEDGNEIEGSEAVYGVRIDETAVFDGYEAEEEVVLVINLGSQKNESVEKFLQFLFFTEEPK